MSQPVAKLLRVVWRFLFFGGLPRAVLVSEVLRGSTGAVFGVAASARQSSVDAVWKEKRD